MLSYSLITWATSHDVAQEVLFILQGKGAFPDPRVYSDNRDVKELEHPQGSE